MHWDIRQDGTLDLSLDRDEFSIVALCLSRFGRIADAAEVKRSLSVSREDLDGLSWDLSMAQGDYDRALGSGPDVELS